MNKAELRRIADNVNKAKKERQEIRADYGAYRFEEWKSKVLLEITNNIRSAAFAGQYEYRHYLKETDPRCREFILREFSDFFVEEILHSSTIVLSWRA